MHLLFESMIRDNWKTKAPHHRSWKSATLQTDSIIADAAPDIAGRIWISRRLPQ